MKHPFWRLIDILSSLVKRERQLIDNIKHNTIDQLIKWKATGQYVAWRALFTAQN